jgi:hypothetical protein
MARNKMHASLGFLAPLKGSMNEFVGAGIGVAGALGLKWALKQSWMSWAAGLPDPILKLAPVVGSLVAGGAAYYAQHKSGKAASQYATAVVAGAALSAWDFAKAQFPESFADVVSVRLNSYGLPINDPRPRFRGLIVNDSSSRNLNQLAAMSMGDDVGGSSMVDMDYDY